MVLSVRSRVEKVAGAEEGVNAWCAGSARAEEISVVGEEVGTFG